MGIYTNISCSESNPYVISNTTGSFTFTISRGNLGGAMIVQAKWSINGHETSFARTSISGGDTKTYTILKTSLLSNMENTGQATLTLTSICNNETITYTTTVKVDATQIKPQYTSTSNTIYSTPLSGIAVRGYSTIRFTYTARKGYGASNLILDFSVAYGISGEFNPSTYTTPNSPSSGYTYLTVGEGASDVSFYSTLEARDSRGQTVDRKNIQTTWKGYTKPNITASIRRCDSGGNYDESGEYVKIRCSATYSLTSYGNTGSVEVQYGGNTYHNGDIVAQAVNVARTYTVVARDTVLDSASETVTQSITVNMAKFPLDLYDDGRGHLGARVGTIAESGYFSCGLKQKGIYFYGTCSTGRSTARKVCNDVDQTFQLYTGVLLYVKFTNANGKANPTLNVNGTGAIAIRRYGTTAPSTSRASSWNAGSVVAFIYDGSVWQMVGWINTTYSAISQANIEATRGTSTGLITGQRFTQGFDARLTKSAVLSRLGATGEKTVHLGGMSAYSTATNTLRTNIPIPRGATISVAIDSTYTSWDIANSSTKTTVTVSNASVIDTDICSATIRITLTSNALTRDRAYNFKNGQIKVTIS